MAPECSLIRAAWPEAAAVQDAAEARAELDWVVRLIDRGPHGALRDECRRRPSPCRCCCRVPRPRALARAGALDRRDPPPGRATEIRALDGDAAEGRGAGRGRRGDGDAAAGRRDRPRRRARAPGQGTRARRGRGRQDRGQARQRRLRLPRAGGDRAGERATAWRPQRTEMARLDAAMARIAG